MMSTVELHTVVRDKEHKERRSPQDHTREQLHVTVDMH